MLAGPETIQLCINTRHCTQIPPGFTASVTRGIPLLPCHSIPTTPFIVNYNLHSFSLHSNHPCIQRKSSSLQEQIRLQTNFLSMPADSRVVLQFSLLLASLTPAPETEEERMEEVVAPPSLQSQAACASPRSSSSSFTSLQQMLSGPGWWKTEGGDGEK